MEREVENKTSYIKCYFKLKFPTIEQDSPSMPYEFTCDLSEINNLKVLKRQYSNGNIGVTFNWFDFTKQKTHAIEFVYKKWDSNTKCSDKEIKTKQKATNNFLDFISKNELVSLKFHLDVNATKYTVKQVTAAKNCTVKDLLNCIDDEEHMLCSLTYDLR